MWEFSVFSRDSHALFMLPLRPFRRVMSSFPPLPPPPPLSSLRGTVQSHTAYILLHSPPDKPPQTFPTKGPVSAVHKRLQLGALKWGGVVNWVWWNVPQDPKKSSPTFPIETEMSCALTAEDPLPMSRDEELAEKTQPPPPPTTTPLDENYGATVFSRNGRLSIPQITLDNVDEVDEKIRQFALLDSDNDPTSSSDPATTSNMQQKPEIPEVHMFICTHMARDCRCGLRGGEFARVVREQIAQRGFTLGVGDGEGKIRIRLGEVGHVGGHQYAPNVLIYPYGDWYGVLDPSQVPRLLDELDRVVEAKGVTVLGKTDEPLLGSLRDHWRGRMGMSKEEQVSLADSLRLGKREETA